MTAEYTHVLAVTVELVGLNSDTADPAYLKGVVYNYDANLNLNGIVDPRVKKVFYYDTMLLCLLNLDSNFGGTNMDTNAMTAALEPIVESLFSGIDRIYFRWMIRPINDLVGPDLTDLFAHSDGAAGGSNFGNRGG